MAKYMHPNVLDQGLQYVIDSAAGNVDMLLLSQYTQGESYAVVNTNVLATINMTAPDFSLGNQGTLGRALTVATKSGTASGAAATPDLHIALVDVTNSRVLAVTDETSDQPITGGNPITVPAFNLNMNQPV